MDLAIIPNADPNQPLTSWIINEFVLHSLMDKPFFRKKQQEGKTAAENDYFGLLTMTDEDVDEIMRLYPYVFSKLKDM